MKSIDEIERTMSDLACNDMSLRDWFAGMALPMAWESEHAPHLPGTPTFHGVAHKAYQIADAMLQERLKRSP